MTVQVNGQEVTLAGTVGAFWFDEGFTHAEVVTALAGLEGDITVRLNSGGGIAAEGAAIHSALVSYDGEVSVIVEGIAASAASLIAMAGKHITMADGSVLMIHDPQNYTFGNSADHAKTIEELEAYATAYARVYAKRSGKTVDECRDIMKAETWLDGEAAVAAGFADAAGAAKGKPMAAYDYRAYAKAPKRLVAQAKAKNWSMPFPADHSPTPAASAATEESEMTEKERADALAAELATMKAEKATAEKAAADARAAAEQAVADAVKADRERRTAVLALEGAKGREALAEKLLMTKMSVDEIKDMLEVAPKAEAKSDAVESPENYEAQRLAGAAVNGGVQGGKPAAKASWSKVVARFNKNNK